MKRRAFLGLLVSGMAGLAVGCAEHGPDRLPTEVAPHRMPGPQRPRPLEPAPAPPSMDPMDPYHNAMVREVHRDACERGNLESCDYYASMLRSGLGGPADQIEALKVSTRACNRGHNPSCKLASAQRQRIRRTLRARKRFSS